MIYRVSEANFELRIEKQTMYEFIHKEILKLKFFLLFKLQNSNAKSHSEIQHWVNKVKNNPGNTAIVSALDSWLIAHGRLPASQPICGLSRVARPPVLGNSVIVLFITLHGLFKGW